MLQEKRIGLCLSGGGLRAIVHLGVLQLLEERDIKPGHISGTSAGAIIGALYASGLKAGTLMEILGNNTFFSRRTLKLQTGGIFSTGVLTDIFKAYLPQNDFSHLNIPLTVAATDINLGTTRYFTEGDLHKALLATAGIPFIFPSTNIGEHIFCDGGLLNNLPIEPLQANCDLIIAAHVNAVGPMSGAEIGKLSPKAMLQRLFHIGMAHPVNLKKKHCDIFIEPPDLVRYSMFSKKNARELFDLGYEHAKEALVRSYK